MSVKRIVSVLGENSPEQAVELLGSKAMCKLYRDSSSELLEEVIAFLNRLSDVSIELPIEIDKNTLSNGEKQIFIMALYHSLVRLCKYEIPFIIDTPFARIDTEHRKNIAEHFFCELKGQVFILSTNEEIKSSHIKIMKDKILATYMLENTDNKRTTVVQDSFFEVNHVI